MVLPQKREQKKTCGGRGTKWMASNLRGVNESLEEEKPMIITIHNVIRIKDCLYLSHWDHIFVGATIRLQFQRVSVIQKLKRCI